VGIASGKFQGVIAATTPTGTRIATPNFCGSSHGAWTPKSRRPSPAIYSAVSMPSWTSPRASANTLPISRDINWPSSSFRWRRI